MFRLKSNALQREFKVNEGYLYASRIRNTRSGMDLVPDGNSTEFTFHFTDGTEFSSKGLKVTDSAERDGKLVFTFEEFEGHHRNHALLGGPGRQHAEKATAIYPSHRGQGDRLHCPGTHRCDQLTDPLLYSGRRGDQHADPGRDGDPGSALLH